MKFKLLLLSFLATISLAAQKRPKTLTITPDSVVYNLTWPGGLPRFVVIPANGKLVINYDFTQAQSGDSLFSGIKHLQVALGGDSFQAWKDSGVTNLSQVKVKTQFYIVETGQSYNLGSDADHFWILWGYQVGSWTDPTKRKHVKFVMTNESGRDIKVVVNHFYMSGSF